MTTTADTERTAKAETDTGAGLMRIIEKATFLPDFDVAKLQALLEMRLRWEANEARKAYIAAIQRFKADPPDINKTHHVSYANRDGSQTDYYHPELDKITNIIGAALKVVGITHNWKTSDTNGKITVTCVLTHERGHSEEAATLSGPADTSGGKNSIQAIGSTVTYLQRYTLLAATGLAAKGTDDDGKTEGMAEGAIEDYCVAMRDTVSLVELKPVFKEGWEKATRANDMAARERLRMVYEGRKRELTGTK